MDGKTLKLYEALMKHTDNDFYLRKEKALLFARDLLALGTEQGLDACHYLFLKHEKLFEYNSITQDIAVTFFGELLETGRTKVQRAVLASPVLIKGFYGLNDRVFSGETLELLLDLTESGKLDDAETLLRAVMKNEYVAFGAGMAVYVNAYLDRLRQKQCTATPALPKKTVAFLQGYIDKIKTEEKFLLTQRIKELL